jgi:hypothetical protein
MPLAYLVRPLHAMVWACIVNVLVHDQPGNSQRIVLVIVRTL